MYIRDVMTARVSVARPDATVLEVAQRMRDDDIGSVPVAEGDRLIGMVTDRDIVTRALAEKADLSAVRARDVMSPKVFYCFEDDTVTDVLVNMREERIRRLPVVSREKRLVGVVSIGDLSQAESLRAGDALKGISRHAHH
jgi:CBS domain-containing protein